MAATQLVGPDGIFNGADHQQRAAIGPILGMLVVATLNEAKAMYVEGKRDPES